MLINSDFERHGFILSSVDGVVKKYIPIHCSNNLKLPTHILTVTRTRKGIDRVHLWAAIDIGFEMMWSPEQLRLFLLFHKVIMDNQK